MVSGRLWRGARRGLSLVYGVFRGGERSVVGLLLLFPGADDVVEGFVDVAEEPLDDDRYLESPLFAEFCGGDFLWRSGNDNEFIKKKSMEKGFEATQIEIGYHPD